MSEDREQLAYAAVMGEDRLRRVVEAFEGRCPECWATPGMEHSETCPDRSEEPEPISQTEALF